MVRPYIASDIHAKMMGVCGNSINYNTVKRWCCEFLSSHMEIADELHQEGQNVIKLDSIAMVRALIEENGCISVAEIRVSKFFK